MTQLQKISEITVVYLGHLDPVYAPKENFEVDQIGSKNII